MRTCIGTLATYRYTYTLTCMYQYAYVYTSIRMPTCAYICQYTYTFASACTRIHMAEHVYWYVYVSWQKPQTLRPHTYTYAYMHTRTYTCTHSYAYTCTFTHMYYTCENGFFQTKKHEQKTNPNKVNISCQRPGARPGQAAQPQVHTTQGATYCFLLHRTCPRWKTMIFSNTKK